MNISVLVKYIVFFAFILFQSNKIIQVYFFSQKNVSKEHNYLKKLGFFRYVMSSMPNRVAYMISLVYAYIYADLSYFWLIYFLFLFVLFVFGCFFNIVFKYSEKVPIPELTEKIMDKKKKEKKIISIFDIFILVIWIYSWRYLLIDILNT